MFRKLFPDDWKVKGYNIKPKDVLGQGACGVVYKAKDLAGNSFAAKRIDLGRKHVLPDLIKSVEKLKQLNHPNIVKVYDMVQEENVVWMFMELCEHGDLNKFCREKEIALNNKYKMIQQIAEGVEYLHKNNVVHRDIKPENILVAKESPLLLKLTDFDVSKFFEEIFDTSAMSTNVGTLAFKAPEFFQRTPDGKLLYHRNVDVYAMGLTFLALLQANSETNQLKPQIETHREPSEKFTVSIGQLIAERKKCNVKELGVIEDEGSASRGVMSRDAWLTHELRLLIKKMTHVVPEQRSAAQDVCNSLEKIKIIPDVSLTMAQMFETRSGIAYGAMFVNSKNHLFVGTRSGSEHVIEVYERESGRQLKQIKHQCDHVRFSRSDICEHPSDPDRLLEACRECGKIRCYNLNSGQWNDVYTGTLYRICHGPPCAVLGVDDAGRICQFVWNELTEELTICHAVKSNVEDARSICYEEKRDMIIVSTSSTVRALSRLGGTIIWENMYEKDIRSSGVCCDDDGLMYVACLNGGILILDSHTGQRLQQPLRSTNEYFYDITWTKNKPQLTVSHGGGISCFNVYEI